jgi:hypothetical protein
MLKTIVVSKTHNNPRSFASTLKIKKYEKCTLLRRSSIDCSNDLVHAWINKNGAHPRGESNRLSYLHYRSTVARWRV